MDISNYPFIYVSNSSGIQVSMDIWILMDKLSFFRLIKKKMFPHFGKFCWVFRYPKVSGYLCANGWTIHYPSIHDIELSMVSNYPWYLTIHVIQLSKYPWYPSIQVSGYQKKVVSTRVAFELEFSGSSRAMKLPSWAELGYFNFQAETELTNNMYVKTLQIFTPT